MAEQTIQSFLVSLGFKLDASGSSKFEQALSRNRMQAAKLAGALAGAEAAVIAFATKVASGMDQLYFASQRTGATVQGIQSIGYAASQTGSSAQAAQGALEGLARFVRNNPGGESWINRLGVQTRTASGQMRDTADVFMDIGQRLQRMPFYQRNQLAQQLGIDEKTLIAMSNGMRRARDEYNGFAHDIGYNGQRAARESHEFMTAMRRLYSVSGLLSDKIGSDTAGSLTNSVNYFTQLLVQNEPTIEHWADVGINAVKQVGKTLYDNRDSFKTIAVSAEDIASNLGDVLRAAGRLAGLDMGNGTFASSLGVLSDRIRNISSFMSHLSNLTDDLTHRRWSQAAQDAKALLSETFNGPAVRGVQAGWHGLVNAANQSMEQQGYVPPRQGSTLAERNNNPGNIRASQGGFRHFDTALQGWQAMSRQLLRYYNGQTTGRRLQNVRDIISTWAPSTENNTSAYIKDVAQRLHVNPNQRIDLQDSSRRLDLMRAIARHEGYSGWNSREAAVAANNTTVNVTVHGNGDARQIGREVAYAVDNANSRNSQVTGARSR